ncbi:NAD-dependent epimerase/dehydratase family protein, partial [Candidatus Falkowbacteria bacterium]|nr:NAD-dependent epimerase/dehydratase family protein [Candidatus Falkowbacteria bacterium]
MKNKTILITGGVGFIGSYLCEKYLEAGHKIICLDNLQTTGSTKNIEKLLGKRDFKFIKHDIIEPINFREKVDWLFNLACSGSPTSYQYDPIHTIKTNTLGMINMLELACRHGARIMQFSTSEVYGDPQTPAQNEAYNGNVNPLGPRACYDEGKRCAETLCMDYYREYGVDVKIIRIFNTYG